MNASAPTQPGFPLAGRPGRQAALITLAAIAVYLGLRQLPTGTNLNHMDFRVDAKNSIEFCDPLNPQFIPVVAMRSPVTMTIEPASPVAIGSEARRVVTLRTASGKAVAPADLVVTHTERLHLLIVDPSLADYQHVHPRPGPTAGQWEFSFTPRAAGAYRVFADFTPAATGRGLYASADLAVGTGAPVPAPAGSLPTPAEEAGGFQYALTPARTPLVAGQPVDLKFTVSRPDAGPVPLQPVMGAFAHLVAFDVERSGFAHLHPVETDLARPPDSHRPQLNFKVTIPQAGRFVVWAQVNVGGREVFTPFWFDVVAP